MYKCNVVCLAMPIYLACSSSYINGNVWIQFQILAMTKILTIATNWGGGGNGHQALFSKHLDYIASLQAGNCCTTVG